MDLYNFQYYLFQINEGLIKTYPIEKTIRDISNLISSYNIKFNIINLIDKFEIELDDINSIDNFDKILDIILSSLFNQYGWFPSKVKIVGIFGNFREYKFNKNFVLYNIKNHKSCTITFESKFDEIVDVPKKLYHLSIQQHSKDIEQKGLICKGKSKLTKHDYDGRIYLCKSKKDCETLIPRMKFFYEDERLDIIRNPNNPYGKYNKNIKWVIYEIDTDLANIKKLYKDPNYLNGYYYLDNISRKSIKVVDFEN